MCNECRQRIAEPWLVELMFKNAEIRQHVFTGKANTSICPCFNKTLSPVPGGTRRRSAAQFRDNSSSADEHAAKSQEEEEDGMAVDPIEVKKKSVRKLLESKSMLATFGKQNTFGCVNRLCAPVYLT